MPDELPTNLFDPGATAGSDDAATARAQTATADRYLLGDEIAHGGMGVIHVAIDAVLGREVAVKVLHARFGPGSGAAHRFEDEARITGQLQHPGIPAVHDLGQLPDGRPFLAMKLVKGETLERLLADRPDLSADRGRFVAAFEQVCQAVAFAHDRQVIHRDLKPANVMVGAFGEVQVMDWGLAKVLSDDRPDGGDAHATTAESVIHSLRDSDGSYTLAGSVLGTPAFMPPEQAVGAIGKIDTRSDVFGLGAILAVILTGQPPFGNSSAETTRIRAAQGKLDDCLVRLDTCAADPELVALCKRCLNPDPAERPADAGVVATAVAELRRAADERARRAELDRVKAEGAAAAAQEQRKRRRVQLVLAAAVVGLLAAGGFGAAVAVLWRQAEGARHETEVQRQQAEERRAEADNQRGEAEAQRREADAQRLKARQYLYYSRVGLAARAWDDGQAHLAGELLRQDLAQPPGEDLRGFEWHYHWRLHTAPRSELRGHTDVLEVVAWSPDGRRLATGSRDMTLRLWNADGTVPAVHVLAGHTGTVEQIAWCPTGDRLATVSNDQTTRVWNSNTGQLIKTLVWPQVHHPGGGVEPRRRAPGHRRLGLYGASVGHPDVDPLFVFRGHKTIVYAVAFSPNGRDLASASFGRDVLVCDAATGEPRYTLTGHSSVVFCVAWSPDGRRLATASGDGSARIWEAGTGRPLRELRGHTNKVYGVASAPDGKVVATSAADGTVRLWWAESGEEVRVFRGHTGRVTAVAFHPDGNVLASSSYDKTVRFWDAAVDQDSLPLRGHSGWVWGLAFAPDGRTLATTSGPAVRFWDLTTGRVRASIGSEKGEMRTVAYSPDGRLIAGGSSDALVTVWDAASGKPVRTLSRHKNSLARVAFSHDGRYLATATGTNWYADLSFRAIPAEVKVWRVGDWQVVATLTGHDGGVTDLAFSPDGSRLVTSSFDGSVRVFELATGAVTRSIKWAESWPSAVAVHPDGVRLATGSQDGTLQLWDLATGRQLQRFQGHTEDVMGIAFNSDGTRLVSGSHDSLVKLWDPVLGYELMTLRGRNTAPVMSVAFSRDGHRLAAGYQDNTARVWDGTPRPADK